jgi:hypothetical protein
MSSAQRELLEWIKRKGRMPKHVSSPKTEDDKLECKVAKTLRNLRSRAKAGTPVPIADDLDQV